MTTTIRQLVKVADDGRIEIRSPQLRAGATAEVVVTVESAATSSQLDTLDRLQQSLGLDAEKAQAWTDAVRSERAHTPRGR
jgi:hypothetical protein